ncbi:hypothetical protein V2K16_20725 [Pseudomonas alliivorans]|uniref:hypothetical protein n=1 Tax=Pseudomonas alliivorans TaxID=2810613 RepID=UPI001AE9A22A|nr:hypothetical protein [Pseudomonas alliivorans]MBP0942589.1 hypothetical protein [Pseudomonas alliivorans]MEE4880492.1 hypothetical protein [Pseudomonas alliivorans]MEE4932108.1 hypothetical protein [Pseudomonas alliivorans]MEE4937571.1 hypothetical protein [Pseudomonas alliivorans]MEE4943721.1 hypothetical protein [Pseudomonas alliivorans]
MSLKSAHSPVAHQLRTGASVNEMQREDFLALAAALRQFNTYEAQVSMVVAAAQPAGAVAVQAS